MDIEKFGQISQKPQLDKISNDQITIPIQRKLRGPFIPPIPIRHFATAARVSGKALAVFMYLWYLSAIEKSLRVKLSNKSLLDFGVNRKAKSRALEKLTASGLIAIEERKMGAATVITLIAGK